MSVMHQSEYQLYDYTQNHSFVTTVQESILCIGLYIFLLDTKYKTFSLNTHFLLFHITVHWRFV